MSNHEWVGTDQPFNYDLDVLTIVNNEGEGFDIRKIFFGLKLHESITQHFLLGEVSIQDATGFLENAKLFGQETLRLRFASPGIMAQEKKEGDLIDQVFRIYHVGEVKRAGQDTLIYNLRFCAPEAIHAKRKRISQAFRGSMIQIASQIARDKLGIELNDETALRPPKLRPYFETNILDKNEDTKVVIPNWTVNYAIDWLCREAQGRDDEDGLQDSFFFYQTANGGYRIESLSKMIIPSASGTNFVYTTSYKTPIDQTERVSWDYMHDGIIGMGKRIQAYEIGSIANVMEATVGGLFASKQTTVFTREQYMHEASYNYHQKFFANNEFQCTADNPLIRQEPETLHWGNSAEGEEDVEVHAYDNELIYGEPISNYRDANKVLTSQTSKTHDLSGNIKSAADGAHMGTTLFRQAVGQLLKYYTLTLVLPCRTDISTGTIIEVEIPPAKPGDSEDPIFENYFHTGAHLITDITWEMSMSECKVNVKCIKDSLINQIETTRIKLPPIIKDMTVSSVGEKE